jgi:uncharacterized protein (TIGR00251 family)
VIEPAPDGIILPVRVVPRAGRSGIDGIRQGAFLVRLNAPPVEGAANDELIDVIARTLHVPRRNVTIVSGGRSRNKRVHVSGIDLPSASARLGDAPDS